MVLDAINDRGITQLAVAGRPERDRACREALHGESDVTESRARSAAKRQPCIQMSWIPLLPLRGYPEMFSLTPNTLEEVPSMVGHSAGMM